MPVTCFTRQSLDTLTREVIASTPEAPWYQVATDFWAVLASEGAYLTKEGA